jgi:branched-chain amino acid transport system permease protein
MVTLGLCLLLYEVANKAHSITGGDDGLQGVHMWPLLGRFQFDLYGTTAYGYALVILFLSLLVLRRLVNSPFGLSLRGIRENPRRMPAIGSPMSKRIRTIYTISAAFAGLAGGLLAQTTEFVALDALSFQRSAEVLVMLVLGGAGRLYGGLIGAMIFMIARDQLADMNPQYWYFWLGLLLIAVIVFLPNGILGGCAELVARWRRKA